MRSVPGRYIIGILAAAVFCQQGAAQWQPGIVDRMAGRFGEFMEGYRYRKMGYLSLIADGTDLYSIPGGALFLGRPALPSSYLYRESYTWVCGTKSYAFEGQDGSKGNFTIHESLLAPGFLYETDQGTFRWCLEEHRTIGLFVLPLAGGHSSRTAAQGYDAARDGPLEEAWILVSFQNSDYPYDCPLLFVLENRPARIEVVTHEFMDLRFEGGAGKIAVMPLYGAQKIPFERTLAWKDSIPDELAAECSRWRERLQHYPVSCREEYRFEGDELTVRNTYGYVSFREATSGPLAPVPPYLRLAQLGGYPLRIREELEATGYPTICGPLDYVTGPELVYSIPACPYVDQTVAPVRVRGVPGIEKIESALASYLAHPDKTWAGDEEYLPDGVMDTMHNLRLLAWTAWSLPEPARRKAIQELRNPGLDKFGKEPYLVYRDPVAGAEYARDSTVFAQRGKVSYDADWYNGFTLAGLWAYSFYGDRKEGLRIAGQNWDLLTLLRNYMEIYHDWALCCSVTDPRGNLVDWDCMRNGWLGLLAYGRLARDLGRDDQYRQARYLASKEMAALYVNWTAQDYYYGLEQSYPSAAGQGVLQYSLEDITGISHLSTYDGVGYVMPDSRAPYNLSAAIVEHNLFLTDFNLLQKARHLTYELMPRFYPDLNQVVAQALGSESRPGWWGYENRLGSLYFYFLDPHLCLRALNFHEPLEKLLSYLSLENLSGPQIGAFLAGSRPILVIPTNVEFKGNVWDEKEKSLTFILASDKAQTVSVKIRNCPPSVKITPPLPLEYDSRKKAATITIKLEGTREIKLLF